MKRDDGPRRLLRLPIVRGSHTWHCQKHPRHRSRIGVRPPSTYSELFPAHLFLQSSGVSLEHAGLSLQILCACDGHVYESPGDRRSEHFLFKKSERVLANSIPEPSCRLSLPAAFSMLSKATQFARATWTFSCRTSLTASTLFMTAASLSTSARLSYFSHNFRSISPELLSRPFSFTSRLFVPVLAKNCVSAQGRSQTRKVTCATTRTGKATINITSQVVGRDDGLAAIQTHTHHHSCSPISGIPLNRHGRPVRDTCARI